MAATLEERRIFLGQKPGKARFREAVAPKPKIRISSQALVCLFVILAVQLFSRVQFVSQQYAVASLRQEIVQADAELRQLEFDVSYRSRPERLRQLAKQRLVMRDMEPNSMRRLDR